MKEQKIYKQTLNNKQIMKNKMIKLAVVAAASVALAQTVQAGSINGTIGFTGTYNQVGGTQGNLPTATEFTINESSVAVQDPTGIFASGPSSSPTFASPIDVGSTPAANNLVGENLWTVVIGGVTYNLLVGTEAQGASVVSPTTVYQFGGTGTIGDGNSADDTAGTWNLSFNVTTAGDNASFTWNSTSGSTATVPDGGTTAMLLGAGLSGLALLKRKLVA